MIPLAHRCGADRDRGMTRTPVDRRRLRADSRRRRDEMSVDREPSGAGRMFGDFAPALVGFTDDVLFGQVWERGELSPRDRSLVTVAALVATGSTEQLPHHLGRARSNGVSDVELIELITHLAFYAGWPRAMSAMAVARRVLLPE
jgi:4-carboxymuconolactone decarboxylase